MEIKRQQKDELTLRDSCKDCLIRIDEHRCPGVAPKHKCLNDGRLPLTIVTEKITNG